jgi:hypothetical protein
MKSRHSVIACVVLIACCAYAQNTPTIPNTTTAINSSQPLSQRVVAYNIDAKYNSKDHTLDATEVLTYHNLTGQPLDRFPFHLYLNAFQPTATWLREIRRDGTRDIEERNWESKNYGADEIKSFEVIGMGDLTSKLQYIQPDDNNKDDHTVIQIELPKPVPPNAYVQFNIKFHDQFPETLARTGWKRDFLLAGQWFPKVGVWWQGAWNCHQFHGTTEFFADFGVYDVKLTVPQNEVVGASGVEVSSVNNPDGTKTVSYHGDDIHDFAWTASPHYKILNDTYSGSMGPVAMRIMMQPAHWSQAERHRKVLKETLTRFEQWYGPYAYKTITLVDPEAGSAAEGMEYPTFITGGTTWWMPNGVYLPELVVEHEFGHQYWYGMVASNEFEDAWMDEGINSYTEVKVMDSILGPDTSIMNMWGITGGERGYQRFSYKGVADLDPMARKGWGYATYSSYGGITYGKTAVVLLTLENMIGEDMMRRAMHTYFMKYRFTHPTKEDFLKTIEEVSGQNLRWYFDQAVYGTQVLDYEVMRIQSAPVDWYKSEKERKAAEKAGNRVYRSTIIIHRKADFIFPVDIEVKFENGEKVREHWDGKDRWVRYSYENKKSKVVSVQLDPDHKIHLDRDNFDNSKTAEPHGRAASKLTNYFTFATQWFTQLLAWWLT